MYYPDELIEEIRAQNDIVSVISEYVALHKRGSTYVGLCPFHNEKTPSFSVSQSKQIYHCFGCGVGGNVFTFIMEYENLTFPETVKILAERIGMKLPESEYSTEDRKREDGKTVLLDIHKVAAKYYYFLLRDRQGTIGMDYLTNRGILPETMNQFGLGYAGKYSNALYQYLKKQKFTDEAITKSGLIIVDEKRGGYDRFWNRVIFPIMDVNNRVIGFGGRVMGEGTPKYLNSPETMIFDKSRNLYGLHIARRSKSRHLILCEGYMDVIALHQAGFTQAVASLGTALTEGHANLLKRYADEILISYDSDAAGTKATLRAIPILGEAGFSVKIIDLKPYKDPDEFIKALGTEEFEKRIKNAKNSFYFEMELLEKEHDMEDPDSKTRFHHEMAKRLLNFTDPIERHNYAEAMAAKYFIRLDYLEKLVSQYSLKLDNTVKPRRPESGIKKKTNKEDGMLLSQKILLSWIVNNKNIYYIVKRHIQPKDFTYALCEKAAVKIYEQLDKGQLNLAEIISGFESPDEQKEMAEIFSVEFLKLEDKVEKEKALKDTIIRIKKNSIEKTLNELDSNDVNALNQYVYWQRELQDLEKLHISFE